MEFLPKMFTHKAQFALLHGHLKPVQNGWTHYHCSQDVFGHKKESVGVSRVYWKEVTSCFVWKEVYVSIDAGRCPRYESHLCKLPAV